MCYIWRVLHNTCPIGWPLWDVKQYNTQSAVALELEALCSVTTKSGGSQGIFSKAQNVEYFQKGCQNQWKKTEKGDQGSELTMISK